MSPAARVLVSARLASQPLGSSALHNTIELGGVYMATKADSGRLPHRHAVPGCRRCGRGDRVLQEGVRREGARANGRAGRQDRPCGARDRGLPGDALRSVPAGDDEDAEGAGRDERERLHVRRGRRRGREGGSRRGRDDHDGGRRPVLGRPHGLRQGSVRPRRGRSRRTSRMSRRRRWRSGPRRPWPR